MKFVTVHIAVDVFFFFIRVLLFQNEFENGETGSSCCVG
jgi:hypothetical protein